jgi:hypothetical protein
LLRWLALALPIWLAAHPAAAAEPPAVARPALAGSPSSGENPGVVFFLATDVGVGVAAVGTAHSLPLDALVRAGRVDFYTSRSLRHVGTARRLLAPPGRPFSLPNTTLREDFLVYALTSAPAGVQVLRASREPARPGLAVAVIGPSDRNDQEVLRGTVVSASAAQIELAIEASQDLRGWGGAPILEASSRRVVGLLQAHVPEGGTSRVFAAPITGVTQALSRPLAKGAGTPFAEIVRTAPSGPAARAPDEAPGAPGSDAADAPSHSAMQMAIEYPPPGSRVSSSICGVFVAGRANALRGDAPRFDVVIVLDTSLSTETPAGTDINGNGIVGTERLGRLGSLFAPASTDPGDSILAAEVAAARHLLQGFDARNTRVGLVTFAGDPDARRRQPSAVTVEPLTSDFDRIEAALDEILRTKPKGSTDMAAGVDQAIIELLGMAGARSLPDPGREKVAFFFTDGQPTLPFGRAEEADNVRSVLRAATRAGRVGVRIHSFAIGPEALEGPIAVVEMASRSHGYFTPVRHPGDLQNVVQSLSFADLADLTLTNQTLRKPARYLRSTIDGSFAGLVPMEPGSNRVRAWARADDGAEVEQLREITLDPNAESPEIPKDLAVRRNRLLEDCLRDAKRHRRSAEEQQAEQVRRELMIEIERERERARARAEEQRKQLKIEAVIEE